MENPLNTYRDALVTCVREDAGRLPGLDRLYEDDPDLALTEIRALLGRVRWLGHRLATPDVSEK